ncbi:MAG: hypothetical protein AAF639_02870 [Chloroflexota bacterium]
MYDSVIIEEKRKIQAQLSSEANSVRDYAERAQREVREWAENNGITIQYADLPGTELAMNPADLVIDWEKELGYQFFLDAEDDISVSDLPLDNTLVEEARELGEHQSIVETIHAALAKYIEWQRQLSAVNVNGESTATFNPEPVQVA